MLVGDRMVTLSDDSKPRSRLHNLVSGLLNPSTRPQMETCLCYMVICYSVPCVWDNSGKAKTFVNEYMSGAFGSKWEFPC